MNQTEETSGEKFIRHWLQEHEIKFNYRYKLYDLNGWPYDYAEPDFYLPDYNLYIEYWGMWDNKTEGKEYQKSARKKMAVYYNNKIDFISVFPNQLKMLDYVLEREFAKRSKSVDSPKGQTTLTQADGECSGCGKTVKENLMFCHDCDSFYKDYLSSAKETMKKSTPRPSLVRHVESHAKRKIDVTIPVVIAIVILALIFVRLFF